jgi:hypothetical protein
MGGREMAMEAKANKVKAGAADVDVDVVGTAGGKVGEAVERAKREASS